MVNIKLKISSQPTNHLILFHLPTKTRSVDEGSFQIITFNWIWEGIWKDICHGNKSHFSCSNPISFYWFVGWLRWLRWLRFFYHIYHHLQSTIYHPPFYHLIQPSTISQYLILYNPRYLVKSECGFNIINS